MPRPKRRGDSTYRPDGTTVGDLYLATRDRLWRGMRDEEESSYRWALAVDLLGRDLPLTHIKKSTLEDLAAKLENTKTNRGRTMQPGTINRYLSAVSKALRWAVDEEMLDRMPRIPWQEEPEGRLAWLREEDIEPFLNFMSRYSQGHAVACHVLLVTGMRVGELMSLQHEQIEYKGGTYYVSLEAKDTKTKRRRSIPLPEQIVAPLRALLDNGVPHYRSLYRACLMASRELKLPDVITPHVLRHTAATLMTQRGVPSLTVANLLGHSSLATTRKYSHHTPSANPLANLSNSFSYIEPETTDLRTRQSQAQAETLTKVNTAKRKSMTYGGSGGLVRIRTGVQGFAEVGLRPKTQRKPLITRGKTPPVDPKDEPS